MCNVQCSGWPDWLVHIIYPECGLGERERPHWAIWRSKCRESVEDQHQQHHQYLWLWLWHVILWIVPLTTTVLTLNLNMRERKWVSPLLLWDWDCHYLACSDWRKPHYLVKCPPGSPDVSFSQSHLEARGKGAQTRRSFTLQGSALPWVEFWVDSRD